MIPSFQGRFRFLSNFWPAEVLLDGESYPSVEHAYQAAKTADPNMRQVIRCVVSPAEAKRLGGRLTLRPEWDDRFKIRTMYDLVYQKFTHPALRNELMATVNEHIVEGNTWADTFWGVCNGVGTNYLGRILMAVRSEIAGTLYGQPRLAWFQRESLIHSFAAR